MSNWTVPSVRYCTHELLYLSFLLNMQTGRASFCRIEERYRKAGL